MKKKKKKIYNVNGYCAFYDPTHWMSVGGLVYEHRAIMAEKLGRKLKAHEVVHHLDGDRQNNCPDNLEIMTRTSHGRRHSPDPVELSCTGCGKKFFRNAGEVRKREGRRPFCSLSCSAEATRRVKRPSKEVLKEDIAKTSFSALGKRYGVSDNAVRKWARSYGLMSSPL